MDVLGIVAPLLLVLEMASASQSVVSGATAYEQMLDAGEVLVCVDEHHASDVLDGGFYEDPRLNYCSIVSAEHIETAPVWMQTVVESSFYAEADDVHPLPEAVGLYRLLVNEDGYRAEVVALWPLTVDPDFTEGEYPVIERGLIRGIQYVVAPEPKPLKPQVREPVRLWNDDIQTADIAAE